MPQIDVLLKAKADLSALSQVEHAVEKMSDHVSEIGLKIGVGMLGARSAAKLVEEEFKHVVEAIDEIPGIPEDTIESIHQAKYAIKEARDVIDGWIAEGISAFTQMGQGLGYLAGMLIYGKDAAVDAYTETAKAAEDYDRVMRQAKTSARELAAAEKDLAEVEKSLHALHAAGAKERQVGETTGERINRLTGEAAAAQSAALGYKGTGDKDKDDTERARLMTDALNTRAELRSAMLALTEKETALAEKQNKAAFDALTTDQKIASLQGTISANHAFAAKMDSADGVQRERKLEAQKAEFEATEKLDVILKQSAEDRKKADADALDALDKRAQRLKEERAIAVQRGDKVEANRLLEQERDTLKQIVAAYTSIAEHSTTPKEKEEALARAANAKKDLGDTGNKTSKIEQARQGFSNLSKPEDHFQSAGEGAQGAALEYMTKVGTVGDQTARGLSTVFSGVANGLQSAMTGLINKTMTWKQALGSIWSGFATSMLQAFTQMVAEYAVKKSAMFVVDVAFAAKGLALSAASAAKSLLMWLPSAIAASISSWGIAAALGLAAVVAVVAASGGFASGGYTADGQKNEVAGVVHKGEWVAPKWMVEDPNYAGTIAALEAGRQGQPGYQGGGFIMQYLGGKGTFRQQLGTYLGNGFIPSQLLSKNQNNFQKKWNLLSGTQLYGEQKGPVSAITGMPVADSYSPGVPRAEYQPNTAGGASGGDSSSSSFGGGSGGGSGGSAGSDGQRPTVNILMDKQEFARMMQEQSGSWFEQMHAAQMRKNA